MQCQRSTSPTFFQANLTWLSESYCFTSSSLVTGNISGRNTEKLFSSAQWPLSTCLSSCRQDTSTTLGYSHSYLVSDSPSSPEDKIIFYQLITIFLEAIWQGNILSILISNYLTIYQSNNKFIRLDCVRNLLFPKRDALTFFSS